MVMGEGKSKIPLSEKTGLITEEEFEDFPEEGIKGEDLEWLESRVYGEEDEDSKSLEAVEEESDLGLHSKFVNFSLENDLKGEELEWFKSRICPVEDEVKKEKEAGSGPIKVEILTQLDLEEIGKESRKVILRLSETNTIWFFSLETKYSLDEPEDAERVRRENEAYQMKKTKIEIIRKRCTADAQTPRFIEKCLETLTAPINKADAAASASEWDLYDTYGALDKCEAAPSGKYLKFVNPEECPAQSSAVSAEESTGKLFRSLGFEYASLVTERLLAANCFRPEQLVFKTKYKTRSNKMFDVAIYHASAYRPKANNAAIDVKSGVLHVGYLFLDDTEPTLFSYEIEKLWDFRKDFEHPLFVTDMDWNPLHQDLIAVSYGDLRHRGKSIGSICVWSPKNPRQPERQFQFDDSVTSLHYSKLAPNLLAFGTRKGYVYVIDTSATESRPRILTSWKPRPGPVWKVEWFLHKDLTFETEKLLAVGESGTLMLFFLAGKGIDLLRLDYVTSTINLPEELPKKKIYNRPQIPNEIFEKKSFSGLYFSIFSDRNFCYVATKEGALVKCNLRNPSMTDGVFLAHDGPVYVVEHSPATDLVYLTCGADWSIKIWMEGITQPLITLQHKNPVACARWSPTIPTIIAAVTDDTLSIWDVARNILSPKSAKNFDDLERPLSTLSFSANGANIVLGNQSGLVRVVHLSELPRIPFLQKEALVAALKRALLKKESKVLGRFSRAVEANKEKLKTKIIP